VGGGAAARVGGRAVTRWVLDRVVDAGAVVVRVVRGPDGRVREARLDLAGLPPVGPLLVGRPVADLPGLVARLCGLCPAAHHLAGVRALEDLAGVRPPHGAEAVRRVLHHGAALVAHAPRLAGVDPAAAARRDAPGRAGGAAAGAPGHLPATAVPGGVRAGVPEPARAALAARLPAALAAATRVALAGAGGAVPGGAVPGGGVPGGGVPGGGVPGGAVPGGADPSPAAGPWPPFPGADAALVDACGRPDLLGGRLRMVAADGAVLAAAARPRGWDALVAEAAPGAATPRPHLRALGPGRGSYRVGPVAQLRVGALRTPVAAVLQDEWRAGGAGSAGARAVLAVHAVEELARLLDAAPWRTGPLVRPAPPTAGVARVGVGWVDGPRGLLVHRYAADLDGVVTAATVLTPTAQNDAWLAGLLRHALAAPDGGAGAELAGPAPAPAPRARPADSRVTGDLAAGRALALEAAVREADPCLPCTDAPPGAMALRVLPADARPAPAADSRRAPAPAPAADARRAPARAPADARRPPAGPRGGA
jgi:NAD-reducing hydrogenase large subunit